jgi:hypothetical protein
MAHINLLNYVHLAALIKVHLFIQVSGETRQNTKKLGLQQTLVRKMV